MELSSRGHRQIRKPDAGTERRRFAWKTVVVAAVAVMAAGLGIHLALLATFPEGLKQGIVNKAYDRGFAAFRSTYHLRNGVFRLPTYFSRVAGTNDLEQISIDIEFRDMQRLEAKRDEALRKELLEASDDDYVSGWIRADGKSVKVKLRLKGDNVDHLFGNKYSFRVHVSGDDHLWGLRSFSIQHPKTRGWHAEAIYFETLRKYGVLAPRYSFVNVALNGESMGVMAVEEFFSKELLEANGRKESVIVKFNESLKWAGRDMKSFVPGLGYEATMPFESVHTAIIESFQSSRVAKSKNLQIDFANASGLLQGFLERKLTASDAFDVRLLGTYLAVAEFYGCYHEVIWSNLRFYYNPISLRLEPVAFDASLSEPVAIGKSIGRYRFARRLLEEPDVYNVYSRVHGELVKRLEDGQFQEWFREKEAPILRALQTEYFMLEAYPIDRLVERAEKLPHPLRPDVDLHRLPRLIHGKLVSEEDETYLEISNLVPYDVQIVDIYWVDGNGIARAFNQSPGESFSGGLRIKATPVGNLPSKVRIPYVEPNTEEKLQLKLRTSVVGYPEEREVAARVGYPALSSRPFPSSTLEEQLRRHSFLSVDESAKVVEIASGEWDVNGDILLPPGYDVRVPGGTTLRFDEGAVFVISGVATFVGSADGKITLQGKGKSDGTTGSWQGLAVYDAPRRSNWSHVVVRNTASISRGAWRLTGGVTFYRSNVDINASSFSDVLGEDALNIIHSNFNLKDIEIRNTVSDGFDGDFTTGVIEGGVFEDIGTSGGGDALDFSGSEVDVSGSRFERIGDKAISVGEGSHLNVKAVNINQCGVGAASKDDSTLRFEGGTIRNAWFAGVMAYMKKPEYGPAELIATGIELIDTPTPARLQAGSKLELNGTEVSREAIDIDALYLTVMKPGLRK
jgi:hypothetical protein